MCGIAGFVDFSGVSDKGILGKMTNAIHHRGPDDEGLEVIKLPEATIGLGFRRLSIIDVSALGHQPMSSEDKCLLVAFNGEIYNYQEIKKELQEFGFTFKSNSDTEVILKSFQKWGTSCVDKFVGMFAIVLYDKINEKLHFIRDRAGVKPLYYYHRGDLFLFGSELKSFHQHPDFKKEIDFDSLSLFFQFGYIPAPHCIFKHAYKLLPGHILELNVKTATLKNSKYWDVFDAYNKPKSIASFDESLTQTEILMKSAFQYRMVSDVPVGVFLSGGYDSSAVTALLQTASSQKVKTFTIGFNEEGFNEAPYAKKIAEHLGTDHQELYCTFKEAMDIVPELPFIYDEPFGDSSALPTILVSRIARKHVKVALSADGGDELFAGYGKYRKGANYLSRLDNIPSFILKSAAALLKFFPDKSKNIAFPNRTDKLKQLLANPESVLAFKTIIQPMTFNETQQLIKKGLNYYQTYFDDGGRLAATNDHLSKIQAVEYKTYLMDDILQKVDRATMSTSLEGREPFLDHRLIEFVAQLPSNYKLKGDTGKYILKEIVHKYIPESMMNRPKMGFGIPVKLWCKHELKPLVLEYLNKDLIKNQGIFDADLTEQMLKNYFNHEKVDFQRIWFLLMFQMWYKRWM